CRNYLLELLKRNKMQEDGKVYLQVTRGSAPRDHVFPEEVQENMYAYIEKVSRPLDKLTNGVGVIIKEDIRWDYCYIKCLNLLPNVLAKQEAKKNICYEANLHKKALIKEYSTSNVYIYKYRAINTH